MEIERERERESRINEVEREIDRYRMRHCWHKTNWFAIKLNNWFENKAVNRPQERSIQCIICESLTSTLVWGQM